MHILKFVDSDITKINPPKNYVTLIINVIINGKKTLFVLGFIHSLID